MPVLRTITAEEGRLSVSEIPASAIEAAAKAVAETLAPFGREPGRIHDGSIGWGATPHDLARSVLAAALPFLERATRDKIAAEIDLLDYPLDDDSTRRDVALECARIARGEAAT